MSRRSPPLPGLLATDALSALVEPVQHFRVFSPYGHWNTYAWAMSQHEDDDARYRQFNFGAAMDRPTPPSWRVTMAELRRMPAASRYRDAVQSLPHVVLKPKTIGAQLSALLQSRVELPGAVARTHVTTADQPERAYRLLAIRVCDEIAASAADEQVEICDRWVIISSDGAYSAASRSSALGAAGRIVSALFG